MLVSHFITIGAVVEILSVYSANRDMKKAHTDK